MGIRSLIAFPHNHPASASEAEWRGKRSSDHNKFRPDGCWDSPSMPRAQRSVRTETRPTQNPPPGAGQSPPLTLLPKALQNAVPPSHPGMVSKGRARRPFLWSFQGGSGREI